MRSYWFLIPTVLSILLMACQGQSERQQNERDSADDMESPSAQGSNPSSEANFESGGDIICFASKSPGIENHFNYEFVRLQKDDNGRVTGHFTFAPYGTDGSTGSFKGIWREEDDKFLLTASYIAEGERYEEQRDYALIEAGLDLGYAEANGERAVLPKVPCAAFEELKGEYRRQLMEQYFNPGDRDRLKKVMAAEEMGFTAAEVEELNFMERYVDLDHDGTTAEYLLYIMDPMLCGSGGCNLYVVNQTGDVLSAMSVTRPPIYVPSASIEEQQQRKGEWKDLYVYSKGMRRLVPENGKYPSNPSVEPEVLEEQLLFFPDRYRLVLDYAD